MSKPLTIAIARDPIYRNRRFQSEIIELCVRWYLTYRLSYRDSSGGSRRGGGALRLAVYRSGHKPCAGWCVSLAQALYRQPHSLCDALTDYERRMRPYVTLNQALLDMTREGPVPDEQMDRAKFGIQIDEIISDVS